MEKIFRIIGIAKCTDPKSELFGKEGILKFSNHEYAINISDTDETLEIKDFDEFQDNWKIQLFL